MATRQGRAEVDRAFAFMRRGDMRGTCEEPWRFGTAVFAPEIPLRHDSNYVLLECDGPVDEIMAAAETAQSHLTHRMIVVPDEGLGERLEPAFRDQGWEVHRGLVMVLRRPPD